MPARNIHVSREKAIEAMDLFNRSGFNINIEARAHRTRAIAAFPRGPQDQEPWYGLTISMMTIETSKLRDICDLAESIGLEAMFSLQAIRLWPAETPEQKRVRAIT